MPDADSDNSAFQELMAEKEAFEARFPAEAFVGIAEALRLRPGPQILAGLRRSLLKSFYFFYVSSSGETPSRDDWICALTDMRDAARALLKSLPYRLVLMTAASGGEDDPLFYEKFRVSIRLIAERAEASIAKLRSERGVGGRPRKEFWQLGADLVRVYRKWTNKQADKPRWVGGSKYAGDFYDFVVAVTKCLRANLSERQLLTNLPDNPSSIGDGLRKRWPLDK